MTKRRLTQDSSDDSREKKKLLISPALTPVYGFNEFEYSEDSDDDYYPQECDSSVGSNNPIRELIILSDDDDQEEVLSPSSEIKSSSHEVVAGEESEESKPVITPSGSTAGDEKQYGEIGSTEKKGNGETKEEDEQRNWWVKYGSMIVDDNGFLLGEFRRLDEELYIV